MTWKKLGALVAALALAGVLGGCAYSGVAIDGQRAVVAKNNALFFGLLNKIYVCEVSARGLENCSASESP